MCLLKISVSSVTLAMKLLAIAIVGSNVTLAEDLGVFGELFEIAEEDFMEQIQSKLLQLEKTGRLETAKKKIQRRVKEMILHPQAINGITHTKKTKTFTFDPSITIAHDLHDYRGHVFAKKGERFNPLNTSHFTTQLLFIDGDDED
ncbi:hypothetical protein FACS1894122_13030 [Alphaproteobacteria bacterium]|nr:hypothetical protein FACS1894122_13030 [Alphaproteobacteria bacterium]